MKRALSPCSPEPEQKNKKLKANEDSTEEANKLFERASSSERTDPTTAFDLYQKAADLNHLRARLKVGVCHLEGVGTTKDISKAKEIFEKLSKDHDMAPAHNNLGFCYEHVNDELAFQYYQKAADQELPHGVYNLAYSYHKGLGVIKNEAKAFELYQKAMNLGSCAAIINLSNFYEYGVIVPKDLSKAFELIQMAATHGHSVAEWNLGRLYQYGISVEIDLDKSFFWYQRSADQNFAKAIHTVARFYGLGIGKVQQDHKKALVLYQKSAKLGLSESNFNLGVFYRCGLGDLVKDEAKAFELFLESATAVPLCEHAVEEVALCYFHGRGVPTNFAKAFEFFEKGFTLGIDSCTNGLGTMYEKGLHVSVNKQKAIDLFSKAAERNYALSIYNLGVCYEHGLGVIKDEFKAFQLFQKSYKRTQETKEEIIEKTVSLALARCFENGFGTKKDLIEALKWFRLSKNEMEVTRLLKDHPVEICEHLLSIPLLQSENEKLKQEIEELQARPPGGETFWKAKEEWENVCSHK
jgi:TPR repeat protein